MHHDSLAIGVRHQPGYAIITAAGEIDIFTVARLREELFTLASHGQPVIADLDRVTFLGAAGLGALAGAARRAAARGASLHVVCARPQIRHLLRLTGLDRTLRLARTLPEALQDLPAAPDPAARQPQPVPAPPAGGDGPRATAERPVALARAQVNYRHSASVAGAPHEPAPWCRESIVNGHATWARRRGLGY